jgi:hypothetical protein
MSFNLLNRMLFKRIDRFSLVIKIVLILFGIGAVVSQILKISALFDLDTERNLNFSHIAALSLGIIFFFLAKGSTIQKFVYYALFSGREKIKYFIFFLPGGMTLLVIFALKIFLGIDNPSYERLLGEGGFIEYGTAIIYILTFAFAIPIGNYFFKRKQKYLGIFYYLLAFFCIFVGLEEISWGQTLLSWDGSNFFQEHNIQQETNLHNLKWFHFYLKDGVILISLSILLAQYFFRANKLSNKFKVNPKFLVPDWYLSSFFAICLLLYIGVNLQDYFDFFISKDREFAELILSFGFFFFAIGNYFRQSTEGER